MVNNLTMDNVETVLFSNDSSYGGISFIANHIDNCVVILRDSIRKDFDSMIKNKFFLKRKPKICNNILNKSKRIIVFGTISLESINLLKYKNKEIIVIITDTTFF